MNPPGDCVHKPLKIFISYARIDSRDFVLKLEQDLTRRGFEVWLDQESMECRGPTFLQEIADAIRACDRFLLVIGPNTVQHEYVRREWSWALEMDRRIHLILWRGDHSLIPSELESVHCEDFKETEDYEERLRHLVRQLCEADAPLCPLIEVPPLPVRFLPRQDLLENLRHSVLLHVDKPNGGLFAGLTGLHGMGGIGKSVLAAALARDRKVRQAFPDGVVWINVGLQPDLRSQQNALIQALGFQTEGDVNKLRELLIDKAILLVLDDVWDKSSLEAFRFLGPRCHTLVTTRDAGVAEDCTSHDLQLLTAAEALSLMALCAPDTDDSAAKEVAAECSGLPLSVVLCGGMARRGIAWGSILKLLRAADLKRIRDRHILDERHRSLHRVIQVSVDRLTPEEQRRFAEFSVFVPGQPVPEAAVRCLWEHTGKLDGAGCEELLMSLHERSLVQVYSSVSVPEVSVSRRIGLHDLLLQYAEGMIEDKVGLQRQLISAYRAKCPQGWASGPKDGYFFQALAFHLEQSALHEELWDLARDSTFDVVLSQKHPEAPGLRLRAPRHALNDACFREDAPRTAEFLALHSERARAVREGSALAAARAGDHERAWALAEMHNNEWAVFWHLLAAWEQRANGQEAANTTLERLARRRVTHVSSALVEVAIVLLSHLYTGKAGDLVDNLVSQFLPEEYNRRLCWALCELGKWQAARDLASRTTVGRWRSDALLALGAYCADHGDEQEKAKQVALLERLLPRSGEQQIKGAGLLVGLGARKSAVEWARKIESATDRNKAFLDISDALKVRGEDPSEELKEAFELLLNEEEPAKLTYTMQETAQALLRCGCMDVAQDAFRFVLEYSFGQNEDRKYALQFRVPEAALGLHESGDTQGARQALQLALREARAVADDETRLDLLRELGVCQARIGLRDQALDSLQEALDLATVRLKAAMKRFRQICPEEDLASADARGHHGIHSARSQDYDDPEAYARLNHAWETFRRTVKVRECAGALGRIAGAVAIAGDTSLALEVVGGIKSEWVGGAGGSILAENAARGIAHDCIEAGALDAAREFIDRQLLQTDRDKLLTRVAERMVDQGNPAGALELARGFSTAKLRAVALRGVVKRIIATMGEEGRHHATKCMAEIVELDLEYSGQVSADTLREDFGQLLKLAGPQSALRLVPRVPQSDRRLGICAEIAQACIELGNREAAREALDLGLAAVSSEYYYDKTDVLLKISRSWSNLDDQSKARESVELALERPHLTAAAPGEFDSAVVALTPRLVESGAFDEAKQVARSAHREEERSEALRSLAHALHLQGEDEASLEALTLAYQTAKETGKERRARQFALVARAQDLCGRADMAVATFSEAVQQARRCGDDFDVRLAYQEVCENQLLCGRVEEALSTAKRIADHEEHDEALMEILSHCLERNARPDALALAGGMLTAKGRAEAWLRVAESLTPRESGEDLRGYLDRAQDALQGSVDTDEFVWLKARLARDLAVLCGDWGSARRVFRESKQIASRQTTVWHGRIHTAMVARELARAGRAEEAFETYRMGRYRGEDRDDAALAQALAEGDRLSEALEFAETISCGVFKDVALRGIARHLLERGRLDEALRVCRRISFSVDRLDIMPRIAAALVHQGEIERGIAVFSEACEQAREQEEGSTERVLELKRVALCQAQSGLGDAAVATLSLMSGDVREAYVEVADSLVKQGLRDAIKALLMLSTTYPNLAGEMCAVIAQTWPEQARGIASALSSVLAANRRHPGEPRT